MPSPRLSGRIADETVGRERFRAAMRRLAAGVSLLTTEHQGIRHGLIATAVVSLSDTPPTLIACVNRGASSHAAICAAGTLCVNVLASHHEAVARPFGDPQLRRERFAAGAWSTLATGAPVLADAVAALDCRIDEILDRATHSILIGTVLASVVSDETTIPMIYVDRRFTIPAD